MKEYIKVFLLSFSLTVFCFDVFSIIFLFNSRPHIFHFFDRIDYFLFLALILFFVILFSIFLTSKYYFLNKDTTIKKARKKIFFIVLIFYFLSFIYIFYLMKNCEGWACLGIIPGFAFHVIFSALLYVSGELSSKFLFYLKNTQNELKAIILLFIISFVMSLVILNIYNNYVNERNTCNNWEEVNCITEKAKEERDVSLCEKISRTDQKIQCYKYSGTRTINFGVCEKMIIFGQEYVDDCFNDSEWGIVNLKDCASITNAEWHNTCLFYATSHEKSFAEVRREKVDLNNLCNRLNWKLLIYSSKKFSEVKLNSFYEECIPFM